jgi:hypothetical protein
MRKNENRRGNTSFLMELWNELRPHLLHDARFLYCIVSLFLLEGLIAWMFDGFYRSLLSGVDFLSVLYLLLRRKGSSH